MRGEHPVLLAGRQPGIERHDLNVAPTGEGVSGVADLAFTAQEDQDVTGAFGAQFVDGVEYRLNLVARLRVGLGLRLGLRGEWPVPHFHGVGAARYLDHWSVTEVLAEALRVDGRRGDDDLEIRSARQQPVQVSQ